MIDAVTLRRRAWRFVRRSRTSNGAFRSELLVLFDIVNFARRLAHEISKCLGPAAHSVKTRHARDDGEDSRRDGDPKSFTHVATPLRCIVPDSAPDAEKLGAGEARARCMMGV